MIQVSTSGQQRRAKKHNQCQTIGFFKHAAHLGALITETKRKIMKTKRRCIFPKDVQQILGKTERSGRRVLDRIRNNLGKGPHQYVTDEEFAKYTGIPIEVVRDYMKD